MLSRGWGWMWIGLMSNAVTVPRSPTSSARKWAMLPAPAPTSRQRFPARLTSPWMRLMVIGSSRALSAWWWRAARVWALSSGYGRNWLARLIGLRCLSGVVGGEGGEVDGPAGGKGGGGQAQAFAGGEAPAAPGWGAAADAL